MHCYRVNISFQTVKVSTSAVIQMENDNLSNRGFGLAGIELWWKIDRRSLFFLKSTCLCEKFDLVDLISI